MNALKLVMDAGRPRWSKKGLRRALTRPSPLGDARPPGAARPAVLDLLSAPVFWLGSCGVLHHQPFQIGRHAAVLGFGLLSEEFLEFGRYHQVEGDGFWALFHGEFPLAY